MLLTENFRSQILIDPVCSGADRLCIISGYATSSMAAWHMQELKDRHMQPIHIDLIVGMCQTDGLSLISHKGFQEIIATYNQMPHYSQFSCKYVYKGTSSHSKLFIWTKNSKPISAFIGSANYTLTAFGNQRREIMSQCDPVEAISYFNSFENDSIVCTDPAVGKWIRLYRGNPRKKAGEYEPEETESHEPRTAFESVKLSLLSTSGEVGARSGLNWGQRDGREPNQAYISLPAQIAQSGFFPLNKQHFTVITDDNVSLVLRVQQAGDKAITTPENNSILGKYFRKRLGVADGSAVWKEDLERYGRSDVTFYKHSDEEYELDFSVNRK